MPYSVDEVKKHADPAVVRTFEMKLKSYKSLKTLAPDTPSVAQLGATAQTENEPIRPFRC